MAAYVYGAMALGWGFNELSAGFLSRRLSPLVFLAASVSAARSTRTSTGMKTLLPAALMVGVARSISVVLADGRVIDTILTGLSAPLGQASATTAALLMIPFHVLCTSPVSSVSGHAVLTMPVLVPLSDLLGISRQVTVMAYQTGAGLTELLTPTNGVAHGDSARGRRAVRALVPVRAGRCAARAANRHSRDDGARMTDARVRAPDFSTSLGAHPRRRTRCMSQTRTTMPSGS